MVDPDETQPCPAVPEDTPTSPAIPSAIAAADELPCFGGCRGSGKVLVILDRHPGGEVRQAVVRSCRTCRSTGKVSRRAFAEFHARSQGR
jgi:hypothetical protein